MNAPVKKFEAKKRVDANLLASEQFAAVFQAYLECSEEVQAAIRDMVEILNDAEATEDERFAAASTIAEALFASSSRDGSFGIDLEEGEGAQSSEVQEVLAEMDRQQASFADRVASLLQARNMTQGDLGTAIGVGQSAISMMLNRSCYPQKRTIEKIARAFSVEPAELWPQYDE